jgi:hypothetical protein
VTHVRIPLAVGIFFARTHPVDAAGFAVFGALSVHNQKTFTVVADIRFVLIGGIDQSVFAHKLTPGITGMTESIPVVTVTGVGHTETLILQTDVVLRTVGDGSRGQRGTDERVFFNKFEPDKHAIPNSAAVIFGVLGIISARGVSVGEYSCSLLLEIIQAVGCLAAFSGALQCRKQKRRQYRYDRYNYEKVNKGKGVSLYPPAGGHMGLRHIFVAPFKINYVDCIVNIARRKLFVK